MYLCITFFYCVILLISASVYSRVKFMKFMLTKADRIQMNDALVHTVPSAYVLGKDISPLERMHMI